MNYLFTFFGFVMLSRAETDNQRAIGAVVAGAGLNDVLREHKET